MEQSKAKKHQYHLIHHSAIKLKSQKSQICNIFNNSQNSEYFSTQFPQNPFSLTQTQDPKAHPSTNISQLLQKHQSHLKNTTQSQNFHHLKQTIYKINNRYNRSTPQMKQVAPTKQSPGDKDLKMPSLNIKNMARSKTQRNSNNKIRMDFQKYQHRVDQYLFHHSVAHEVEYLQDLRKRCGDQYFQQILRNRYEDDMKPKPYVYSIKTEISTQTPFIKSVKKMHPNIKMRDRFVLKGINRSTQMEKINISSISLIKQRKQEK